MLNAPIRLTRSPSATERAGYDPPRPTQSTVASARRLAGTDTSLAGFIARARRRTVACKVLIRSAEFNRAIKRAGASSGALASALETQGVSSFRTRANTGVTGPARVSID